MRKLTITMWPGRQNDVMIAVVHLSSDRIAGLAGAEVGDNGVLKDDDGLLAVWELDEDDE